MPAAFGCPWRSVGRGRVGTLEHLPPPRHLPPSRPGSEALVQECSQRALSVWGLGTGALFSGQETTARAEVRSTCPRPRPTLFPHFLLRVGSASGAAPPPALPPPTGRGSALAGGAAPRPAVPSPRRGAERPSEREARGRPRCYPRPACPAPHFPGGRSGAQPSCFPRRCPGLAGKRAAGKFRRAQAAGRGHRALRAGWPRLRARRPARTSAMASLPRRRLRLRPRRLLLLLPGFLLPLCGAFNLDVDSPAEYSGPEGSYFGFAVDFFVPSASS